MKWYNYKDVINLDELPPLQWNSMNQFGDPVYLEIELVWRGLWNGYFALDTKKKLEKFAFVWVERENRYFIPNTSS